MEDFMQGALYVIWALVPLSFFLLGLWSKLEQLSNKDKKQTREAADLAKQGGFTLICVLIALVIDIYFLEESVAPLLPDFIPLGFVQIMLLPVILFIGAKVVGGQKRINITKVSTHEERRKTGSSQSKSKGRKKSKKKR